MFDVFALLKRLWQRIIFPLFQRLSCRVTPFGLRVMGGWLLVVIAVNLLAILPQVGVLSRDFNGIFRVLNWLMLGVSLLLGLVVTVDYLWLLQVTCLRPQALLGGLSVHRQVNNNLSVQAWSQVTLTLSHRTPPIGIRLSLLDNYPLIAKTRHLPLTLSSLHLKTSTRQTGFDTNTTDITKSETTLDGCDVTYELCPTERGFGDFAGVDILFSTTIGLFQKYCPIAESNIAGVHDVRVLANFSQIIQGQLHGVTQKTALAGVLKQQRQGQGQDFRQIRNYTEGDSIRHIDWKATARQHKLMTREFQDERDQNILFLLDCGQHMRHIQFFDEAQTLTNASLHHASSPRLNRRQPQGSHLDQALNAMLLLAEVANRQGDATGFISFAGQQDKIIAPKKGQHVISYLLNQSFDLQPSMLLPDYIAVARTVRSVQKKRSLVILITNTRQEEQEELAQALKLLSAKHVVIMANLIEQDVKDYITRSPITAEEALTFHSVQEYLNMRERLRSELSQETNIHSLNCTPEQLPTLLIQQYLSVKHRHHL